MTAVTIDERHQGGQVVLVPHGSLNRHDTDDLEALIAALGPEAHVIVDLHDVRCDDAAVAILGRDVSHANDVRLVGLSEHHDRLLRYMGIPAARH